MSKGAITKTWLGGVIAIAVGFVTGGVATGLMLAYGGTFTAAPSGNGYDFVPVQDGFFWSMVAVLCVAGLIVIAGGIVQFVAWIGALVNSYQLQDKMWFTMTLLLGVLGLGLIAMIVYVIGAPDGYEEKRQPGVPSRPSLSIPQPT
jgi:hypothetical protein